MRFVVEVRIELKKGVEDPEGLSTKKALSLLGFKNIANVKSVKIFEIELEEKSKEKVVKEAEKMCEKLLANPVIHKYSIKVKEL